ncbi:MAG: hypothetical protein ACFFAE_08655 [Candidatus Hodarchaeota archaeon]
MVDVLDLIALGFMEFIQWYSREALSGSDLLEFFAKQLLIYIILQIITYTFPFLRKILNLLCLPFRWVHVYLHIFAAKEVMKELEEKKEQNEMDKILDTGNLRASLISGLDLSDENPGLLFSFNSVKYAKKVALAPNRLGIVMLIGYLIVTPLAFASGQILTTQLGAIIHLYLFLGIFGVMMPSINDWYFLFHTLMINLSIRPIFIYNSVLIYIVFTFDYVWRSKNFFMAVLIGTIWFLIYLSGLFIISFIAQGGKLKNPKIYWVPIKTSKEPLFSHADVEFLSLEDLDL